MARLALALLVAMGAWVGGAGAMVRADDTEIVLTGTFSTTDAGTFGVTLSVWSPEGCGSELDFGVITVDAIGTAEGVTPLAIRLCVEYTDTHVERAAFTVQLRFESFELTSPPTFEGAEGAHFQIPNRYLVLEAVGEITGGDEGPGVGPLEAVESDESLSFEGTAARTIASAAAGSGVVSAYQEIDLVLNVPAGVYPGTYTSSVLIETVTGP